MKSESTVNPVPAASIIMLRDDGADVEVCMVVRHQNIEFAGGALVFPGGKVDAQDMDEALIPYLDDAADDAVMRGAQIAAIRETFEECGVLLARGEGDSELIDAERLGEFSMYRGALHAGTVTFKAFLENHQLRLACDQLVHFAHWITPEFKPKRFDTHFFLARAPAGHTAAHDGTESTDLVWVKPAEVVAGADNGKYRLMIPTLSNLSKLGTNADEIISLARANKVIPVLPKLVERQDGTYLCIPPEAGYAVNEIKYPV